MLTTCFTLTFVCVVNARLRFQEAQELQSLLSVYHGVPLALSGCSTDNLLTEQMGKCFSQEYSEDTAFQGDVGASASAGGLGRACEGTSTVARNGSPLPGLPGHDMPVTCTLHPVHLPNPL